MENFETNITAIPSKDEYTKQEYCKIIYGSYGTTTEMEVNVNFIRKLFINFSPKRELFLLEAVRNFIRKINFAELNELLEDEEINENEYELAINTNSKKYVITLRDIEDPSDVLIINDLIEKIGEDLKEFTASDISEMFSVKEDQLILHAKALMNQIK